MRIFEKCLFISAALVMISALAGCSTAIPHGLIYTNVTLPVWVSDDPEIGVTGQGEASCCKCFGIILGDAGIESARNDSDHNGACVINRIQRVEYHTRDILGCYGKYTTIVYGEKK